MKGESEGDLKKQGGEGGGWRGRLESDGGRIGVWGCNALSGKWENVAAMTQIGCGVAVTWDGPRLAER